MDHLLDAADDHVADVGRAVALHDVLERPQKLLLEAKVGELALLDELHGQLAQRVHREEHHVLVAARPHLVKVVPCSEKNSKTKEKLGKTRYIS